MNNASRDVAIWIVVYAILLAPAVPLIVIISLFSLSSWEQRAALARGDLYELMAGRWLLALCAGVLYGAVARVLLGGLSKVLGAGPRISPGAFVKGLQMAWAAGSAVLIYFAYAA